LFGIGGFILYRVPESANKTQEVWFTAGRYIYKQNRSSLYISELLFP
jgi:hypothetical protein